MAHFTKEELQSKAVPYFSQGEKVMYATSDGNFFYEDHKSLALSHKSISKTELYELRKDDIAKSEMIGEEKNNLTEQTELEEEITSKRGRKPSKSLNDGTE